MRIALAAPLIVVAMLGATPADSAARLRALDDDVVFTTTRQSPRPGQVFFGVFLRFTQPHDLRVFSLTCTAHLGGRIVHTGDGLVAFSGGVKLRPIIRLTYTAPDANGKRLLQRVACGWRIPRDSARKLLSLLPRPSQIPCDTSCPPLGLDIHYGSPTDTYPTSYWSYSYKTWRVASRLLRK